MRWTIFWGLLACGGGFSDLSAPPPDRTTVAGRVTDPAGAPLGGIGCYLVRDDRVLARTTSDEDGRFELPAEVAGEHRIVVHDGQGRGALERVHVRLGGKNSVGEIQRGSLLNHPEVVRIHGIGYEERLTEGGDRLSHTEITSGRRWLLRAGSGVLSFEPESGAIDPLETKDDNGALWSDWLAVATAFPEPNRTTYIFSRLEDGEELYRVEPFEYWGVSRALSVVKETFALVLVLTGREDTGDQYTPVRIERAGGVRMGTPILIPEPSEPCLIEPQRGTFFLGWPPRDRGLCGPAGVYIDPVTFERRPAIPPGYPEVELSWGEVISYVTHKGRWYALAQAGSSWVELHLWRGEGGWEPIDRIACLSCEYFLGPVHQRGGPIAAFVGRRSLAYTEAILLADLEKERLVVINRAPLIDGQRVQISAGDVGNIQFTAATNAEGALVFGPVWKEDRIDAVLFPEASPDSAMYFEGPLCWPIPFARLGGQLFVFKGDVLGGCDVFLARADGTTRRITHLGAIGQPWYTPAHLAMSDDGRLLYRLAIDPNSGISELFQTEVK